RRSAVATQLQYGFSMRLSEMPVKSASPGFRHFFRHAHYVLSKCSKIKDNRMLSRVRVRPVKTADLDGIEVIERASFGRDAYDRKLFAAFTHKCGDLFLVAKKGSKVVAYSITGVRLNRAELVSIAVEPEYRRTGVAAALLESTLRRLRRRKVTRLVLMVKVTNHRAISFYEKHGFRQYRHVPAYYEDGADGLGFVKLL
ncbi:MAG TPA: ribosomal protein S18-alanine N-acetyltransferase, partial [Verrucomicrobiae bacterium]|nr:ribosomal protein S18-alanine N-acetyltransferase [Verrucomicrobiae bacterium]